MSCHGPSKAICLITIIKLTTCLDSPLPAPPLCYQTWPPLCYQTWWCLPVVQPCQHGRWFSCAYDLHGRNFKNCSIENDNWKWVLLSYSHCPPNLKRPSRYYVCKCNMFSPLAQRQCRKHTTSLLPSLSGSVSLLFSLWEACRKSSSVYFSWRLNGIKPRSILHARAWSEFSRM